MILQTSRLILRELSKADREPFAALNANPQVMEFFPAALTRSESDDMLARIQQHYATHGFGFWAVEIAAESRFVGLIGLSTPRFEAHFTPCVEIGWRLTVEVWGRGVATEGVTAALHYGFERLGLQEIVAMTTRSNVRSRRVMEKLEMKYDPRDDFDHPSIPLAHPLCPHVLYRVRA